ncbi:thymidylate synthase [uncultured Methanocorpusculum sp.]|nr:thymidylate synthase [uncultured Methanocorpusculum sp.]
MKLLRAPNLARAHELVIRYILEKGSLLTTENGEETVETDEVCLFVDTPLAKPMVSPCSRFKEAFLDEYAKNLIEGSDSVFEYDYHGRLFDWGCGLTQNGEIHQDQIQYIIDKLRESPVSRRAVAVTWCPPVDAKLADCPCLQLVQCVVREGKLNMKIVFRSNDMLSAAGSNMFALAKLQEYIAEKIGVGVGTYTHISLVPHVYYKRDAADIPPFCGKGTQFTPCVEVCRACGGCAKAQR